MLDKKSDKEIEILRAGGHILGNIRDQLAKAVKVGVTGLDLDILAEKLVKEAGGKPSFKGYHGFPNAVCVSVNQTVVHGIPNNIAFAEGDLVGIDIGMEYQGFFTDTATTVAIGKIDPKAEKLLKATKKALEIGLSQVSPDGHIGDIGKAIEKYIKPFGFGIVRDLAGHGVGRAVHEDPMIPHYDPGKKLDKMFPGLVIAIEPMINLGTHDVVVDQDNWSVNSADDSLTAHFEHTVVVTKDGCEILT
ncbi:type I methionyl aminopeptidase [bacterium]|jgi:methionyl aminopeptidase|nr:type I methionyl aminopeptidase [bacterium]MBT4649509.1 type I methionyl aminopeptidase [bacterium]